MKLAYFSMSGITSGLKAKSMRKSSARCPVFRFEGSSIVCVPAGGRPRAGRVLVRYRTAAGEFVDTSLDRLDVDDVLTGRPVREFRSYKGRRHYSGWYWSATTSSLLAYESRLELARIMLADFDPAIARIATQPFQLITHVDGRVRRHVPDLLLQTKDGAMVVVDVKSADQLDDPAVSGVFAWTRAVLAARGWTFEAWSGSDARVLANVCFLAGYRRAHLIDMALAAAVLNAAAAQPTIGAIEQSMRSVAPTDAVRPVVLHLLWSGALVTDLVGPLGPDTPIQATRNRGSQ
jgi:hypothetical protein